MTNSETGFNPDWISPPGDTMADYIEEQEWTQAEFSKRIGYTAKHVNGLLSGVATIGEDTALRLEKVTGIKAEFWLSREAGYREALARREDVLDLKSNVSWLRDLPVNEMIKFGWVTKQPSKWEQVHACLQYFGVASPEAWKKQYSDYGAAFRSSTKFEKEFGATISWLRRGERVASSIECAEYSKERFLVNLEELRGMTTRSKPDEFVADLISVCASCGVAVVFAPTPKGCPASAATRWLAPKKALLMLSLRYKTNDHLWFSFFHEAAHILLHAKKMLFLELKGLDNDLENEADQFSCDMLIPPDKYEELKCMALDRATVIAFAESIGVAPAIVVGRLQHDKLIAWNTNLNQLKVRYKWEAEQSQ